MVVQNFSDRDWDWKVGLDGKVVHVLSYRDRELKINPKGI
jgi:hypothetical protein